MYYYMDNGKYGFKNDKGEVVIPPKYDIVNNFKNGFYVVELNGKKGLVNEQGIEIVAPQYDDLYGFDNTSGLAKAYANVPVVKKTGKFNKFLQKIKLAKPQITYKMKATFINRQGERIIPLIYDDVYKLNGKFPGVKLHGKMGIINRQGVEIIPPEYDSIVQDDHGDFIVHKNHLYGIINQQGKMIAPVKYYRVDSFQCDKGYKIVQDQNRVYGYIDEKGVEVFPQVLQNYRDYEIYSIKDGFVTFYSDKKFGLLNLKGELVLPPKYQILGDLKDGYRKIEISLNNNEYEYKTGYLDSNRKEILLDYNYAQDFNHGYALVGNYDNVKCNYKFGLINKKLETVVPAIYDDIEFFGDDFLFVKANGMNKIIDKNNNVIVPYVQNEPKSLSDVNACIARIYTSDVSRLNNIIDVKSFYKIYDIVEQALNKKYTTLIKNAKNTDEVANYVSKLERDIKTMVGVLNTKLVTGEERKLAKTKLEDLKNKYLSILQKQDSTTSTSQDDLSK